MNQITCPECDKHNRGRVIHRAQGRCLIDAEIKRMHAEGAMLVRMAERVGLAPETVGRRLKRMGLVVAQQRASAAPKGADATIWAMRKTGESFSSIASELGMSINAVQKRHSRLVGMLASPHLRKEALQRIKGAPWVPSRKLPRRSPEEKIRSFAEQLIADGWPEHQAWSRARECYAPRHEAEPVEESNRGASPPTRRTCDCGAAINPHSSLDSCRPCYARRHGFTAA